MHDIALILGVVGTARESKRSLIVAFNACMMTGCHGVKPQQACSFTQTIKLQMSIALNAWVWRNAVHMSLHIRSHHMLVKVIRKVEDQVINIQLLCNASSVVNV
jgi:hypothetical protein